MTTKLDTKITRMIDKLYLKAALLETYALIRVWYTQKGQTDAAYNVIDKSAEWVAGYDAALDFVGTMLRDYDNE